MTRYGKSARWTARLVVTLLKISLQRKIEKLIKTGQIVQFRTITLSRVIREYPNLSKILFLIARKVRNKNLAMNNGKEAALGQMVIRPFL